MPDIRYVCLSDLHLGAENSLLTNLKTASSDLDPTQPSPVLIQLVSCLRELIVRNQGGQLPTLVLNGDILEFALATDNEAAMTFERFVELILPRDDQLFGEIVYVPGNHDHHLWETARETQYANYISKLAPGSNLPVPWHASKVFDPDPVPANLLTRLIQRFPHLATKQVNTVYPNFGLLSSGGRRCVVFTHGHFIESIYTLMSSLRTMVFPDRERPRHVWDLEAENFAWIDFFWSTMGRSGNVGEDIERVYERLQDAKQLKTMISNLSLGIAREYDLPGWGDRMEAKLLDWALEAAAKQVGGLERHELERPLTAEAEKGLWAYVEGPLREQILLERKGTMPSDVALVFGHTHKPFQEDMNFKFYPQWVDVYNSGGWVVDTVEAQPLHGGAVILIDEDLNTTSLRMYNEGIDPDSYRVDVKPATHEGETTNPFHERISQMVRVSTDPWSTFSKTVSREVRVRAQNLRARINASS